MQSCTREGVGKERRAVGQSRVPFCEPCLIFLNCCRFTAFPLFIRHTSDMLLWTPSFWTALVLQPSHSSFRHTHAHVNPLTSFRTAVVLQPFQFHSSLDTRMSKPSVDPLLSFWTAVLQPFHSSTDTHMFKLQHFNHKAHKFCAFSPLSSSLKQPAHQYQALCSPFFHKLKTFLFSEYFNWATLSFTPSCLSMKELCDCVCAYVCVCAHVYIV